MRHWFVGLVLVSACLGCSKEDEDLVKKDLAKLQGVWKAEIAILEGKKLSAEESAKLVFTFKGNELIPADDPKDIAIIKIDPSKDPATIDITDRDKKTNLGIYAIDGDTLKLCIGESSRPKTFESAKGSQITYIVMKREKK